MSQSPKSPPALRLLLTVDTVLGAGDSLESINTQLVMDRALVAVAQNNQLYMLRREATDAPSGTTIVEPASGPGRWFKYPVTSGGSSFDPIQNVRFLDAAFAGTPNGSIAEPWTTFAAFNDEVLAAPGGSWELMLPAARVTVDQNIPDMPNGTKLTYQGVAQRSTELGAFSVTSQSGAIALTFRDVQLDQISFDGGFVDFEVHDSDITVSATGTVSGAVRLYNCTVENDGDFSSRTLFMSGGQVLGTTVSFSTGRFEEVLIGDGSMIVPENGTTSFVSCKFGTGVTIDNTNTPTIELDPYSNYWFVLNSVTFGGTIVLTPAIGSGGGFDLIQRTMWLDPASAASTPNGSIAAPFVTWQDCLDRMLLNLSDEWIIKLPNSSVNLTNTGTLSSIQTVTLDGLGPLSTFAGAFAPQFNSPAPQWVFQNAQFDSITFVTAAWSDVTIDNCAITTLNLGNGGNTFNLTALDSTISSISAGSVSSLLRLTNCRLGGIDSAGADIFNGCTVSAGATWSLLQTCKVLDTSFGAGVTFVLAGGTIQMDKSSEFSFLSQGGTFVGLIDSLSGDGKAFDLPNSNAPDLDFQNQTRAILCATRITGNITKHIAATGGAAKQTFTIDSYNTTGFTYSILFGVTTLATIGTGNFRYVFQLDAAATTVSLLSVTKLG